MTSLSLTANDAPPDNLCEMFLRDVAVLLVTTSLIKRSLFALRGECEFSSDLIKTIDAVTALSDCGEPYLRKPLVEAGAVLPALPESAASSVVTEFFSCIPVKVAPSVLATEVISRLRLLVQHIELKAMLAAESALLVGQTRLSRALLKWAAEWQDCGHALRGVMVRVRAKACVADLDSSSLSSFA